MLLLGLLVFVPPLGAAILQISVHDARTAAPLSGVNLALQDSLARAATDAHGLVRFELPPGDYTVLASHIGYQPVRRRINLSSALLALRFDLVPLVLGVPETTVTALRETAPGKLTLSTTEITRCPDPSPDPLRFAKVLPGASSGNDFSNAYNVQGGIYRENLVYVNGVELQLPLQIRHGLAEAISLLNPTMVGQADFYAGSFPVRYGDRLSSVLDVDYRVPERRLAGEAAVSPLQQSLTVEGQALTHWRWLSGWRRADLGRLARGLQTSGEYRPRFWDWQTLVVGDLPRYTQVSLYAAVLHSRFSLQPTNLLLRYNCSGRGCDEFSGQGEGEERFTYQTRVLGLQWKHQQARKELLAFAHVQHQEEAEDTDLLYRLRWRERGSPVSPEFRTIEKYAGRLEEWKAGAGAQARLEAGGHSWEAGTGVQATDIQGWVEGLAEVDHTSGRYPLDAMQAQTDRQTLDRYLYCQGLWHVGRASLAEGLRLSHFDATGEFVVLPRLSLECLLRPGWTLGLAAGRYAQPPLYGEFLGNGGPSRLKAQRADQASLGLDGQMGPASTWRTEVYCRWLRNLVSYSVDDVRVVYSGTNDAKGYAYGMSTLWRGQIAQLVGLISYSYLVTREDLAGDGRGYLPRPTDQRHTASAYLEDQVEALRWKWLGASRFHLRALYGSGFPYTPKVADTTPGLALVDGPRNSRRDHPYFRFDLGMAQTVYLGEWQLQVQEEVGNVFDQYNVVGHTYLPTSARSPVELRHTLGRRVYNVALTARH